MLNLKKLIHYGAIANLKILFHSEDTVLQSLHIIFLFCDDFTFTP